MPVPPLRVRVLPVSEPEQLQRILEEEPSVTVQAVLVHRDVVSVLVDQRLRLVPKQVFDLEGHFGRVDFVVEGKHVEGPRLVRDLVQLDA
eukprot:CAMPEP_0196725466 /NCGR_PEP_ID=MMETSP1091-20130531/7034_1 /TAXON_ID=302021 /ORGANISM="Rhodomonas sp., Strain CCMP768" /LENGTH=89 /DNA_ID=CAMNT_0042067757 /DNA_START=228 /DNA_END=497 /DNA_ORIENTATION=+